MIRRAFPVAAHAGLANAVTATGASLGVAGVLLAARGHVVAAAACCALALPCDVLDGVIARRTGTASEFGAQLDTLADATSFCLLPAALALALGVPSWVLVPAAFYAITGLLRLARFGVVGTASAGGVECFEGVPTSVGAGWLLAAAAATAWLPEATRAVLLAVAYTAFAFGMISAIRFPKHGLVSRSLYAVVPIAIVTLWIRHR